MIFIVAAFSIFTATSVLSPHSKESDKRLQAAYLGKNILSDLSLKVDASTWNDCSGNLIGTLCPGTRTQVLGDFNINYNITEMPNGARKVILNIVYPE